MPIPSAASDAAAPHAGISLGLGLTNECNLACAFCYRDPARTDRLSLDQVRSVMERLPVRSVNLGTGETAKKERQNNGSPEDAMADCTCSRGAKGGRTKN